ncbi:Hypothetical protein RAK1035_0672 [Roseovarius sp. AK1035]|nr:Hypothetical protein RAK1035_0672 [Roseovarius sp. AK1035]
MDIHQTVPFCCDWDRVWHIFRAFINRFLRNDRFWRENRHFVITRLNRVITNQKLAIAPCQKESGPNVCRP